MKGLGIGRVVHFREDEETIYPLMIVRVDDPEDGVITGTVFEIGDNYTANLVPYDQYGRQIGSWHWPAQV